MNRRKSFLINPKFQINLIIKVLVLALVNNLIFFCAVHFFFSDLESTALTIGLPESHIFFSFLDTQYSDLFTIVVIASLISSALIILFGVFISHKIAGPIYRASQDLASMTEKGEPKQVTFRKGDYFQELGDQINNFINSKK